MRHFQKTSFVLCLLCLATSSYAAPTRVRKANEKRLVSLFLGDLRRVTRLPKGEAINLYFAYEGNLLFVQYSGTKTPGQSLTIEVLDPATHETLSKWVDDGADGTINSFQDGMTSPVGYYDLPKNAPSEQPTGMRLRYLEFIYELHQYLRYMSPVPVQQVSIPPPDEPDRLQQRTPEEFPDSPEDESMPPLPPHLYQDDDALA